MKGYKATDQNMRCLKDYQYKLGKTHVIKGKIEPCKWGSHFCEKIIYIITDVYDLESIKSGLIRIFEIEAIGEINRAGLILVTNKIKFIREIKGEELWDKIWNEIDEMDCNILTF